MSISNFRVNFIFRYRTSRVVIYVRFVGVTSEIPVVRQKLNLTRNKILNNLVKIGSREFQNNLVLVAIGAVTPAICKTKT